MEKEIKIPDGYEARIEGNKVVLIQKESEDEKIRKWIRRELESRYVVDNKVNNIDADKAFVWLEKQKDVEIEIEKAYKNADKIQYEKGFEDGVASVKQKEQALLEIQLEHEGEEWIKPEYYTAAIQNAYKDGVRVTENKFKKQSLEQGLVEPMSYGKELEAEMFDVCKRFDSNAISLAEVFYAGVAAQKRIEQKPVEDMYMEGYAKGYKDAEEAYNKGVSYHLDNPNIQKLDPNVVVETRTDGTGELDGVAPVRPAEWSKEDDAIHTRVLGVLGKAFMGVLPTKPSQEDIEWFKSLPQRFNLQSKQEWSEEDKMHLNNAILAAEKEWGAGSCTAKFLKSLRPQPHWKPSDEQMKIFNEAVEHYSRYWDSEEIKILCSLYDDLKKLL